LAEDDPQVRRLLSRVLEAEGYRVIAGWNGRAALEAARGSGGAIDLIVTDVAMPEMTGPDLVRELRAARPGIPAIFITGDVALDLGEVFLSGPSELLSKPVSPSALTRTASYLTRTLAPPPQEEGGDA
jgi:two-component system cell cycle sensor histidine kinase/response regulator CckA